MPARMASSALCRSARSSSRASIAEPEVLSPEQTDAVLAATGHARDRFLVTLLLGLSCHRLLECVSRAPHTYLSARGRHLVVSPRAAQNGSRAAAGQLPAALAVTEAA